MGLLAGFATQLLLILFVTFIGLSQLRTTEQNLKGMVDTHMRKLGLTKTMVFAARERTVNLFRMVESEDPFQRDEFYLQFNKQGADFANARTALLGLPLNDSERSILARQATLTAVAVPLQEEVVDLALTDRTHEAEALLLKQAIPAQDAVLGQLSRLDTDTRQSAHEASTQATKAHQEASAWMFTLSGAALLLGVTVAGVVVYYTNLAGRAREHLATHDLLTGLPNRMLFLDRLEQTLVRARRHQFLVGVAFIDLDRFKLVNDTLGHASGDELIRAVAARLRAAVRAEDIVARLGGDEFVVVVTEAGKIEHILQVAEKVLTRVSQPFTIAGRELFSSCSIGVSVYPHDGGDPNTLIKNADTAMYHAKEAGRNRFQLYDTEMNARAEERLGLETDLHYALERREFRLYYQPQLNLETGRIQAVEALVRWHHPQKGVLGPGSFLDLVEETGDIIPLGRYLLQEACHQCAAWHAEGFRNLEMAVNLCGKEFWHNDLVGNIRNALAQAGLPPHCLHLELTEGILMQDIDKAVNNIQALKHLGVRIAVDDFGTGYSSLAHLKRFPVDMLKIDRYFIKDIQHESVDAALAGSILALCEGLGIEAVAEGVEESAQLERLKGLGCRVVQGHLISHAVPGEDIPDLLARDWLTALSPTAPAP